MREVEKAKESETKLNIPLVALSFSLLLVLGLALSFLEDESSNSFKGDVVIDFNGHVSKYLNESYDLNNGFNIFLWREEKENWSVAKISKMEANENFSLGLEEPKGERHVVFIFTELHGEGVSVLELLKRASEIGGFEISTSHSSSLKATRITAIAGVEDGERGEYWQYWVDGKYATVGADNNYPKGKHTIRWAIC